MKIFLEKKNNTGLLVKKGYESVTSFAKGEYVHKGLKRYVVRAKSGNTFVELQAFNISVMRDNLYENIITRLPAEQLTISYLWAYNYITDEEAFRKLTSMGFNKNYLKVALEKAELKCLDWKVRPNFDALNSDNLEEAAYNHGWGLQVPLKAVMAGINPMQFYQYILR